MDSMQPAFSKLRILLVGSQIEVAGAQKVLLEQARWFQQKGHEVTAVFLYDKAGLGEVWKTQYSFPIIDLEAKRLKSGTLMNGLRFIRALHRFFSLLREKDFDVIETFTIHSNLFGIPMAYYLRIPIRISSFHGYVHEAPWWLHKLHGAIINSKMTNKMVAVSDAAREAAMRNEGVKAQKIKVIVNGVQIQESNNNKIRDIFDIPAKWVWVISVGRLVKLKGYDTLIDIAKVVIGKFPDTIFTIVGEGPERKNLIEKVENSGLIRQVKFIGVRADVPDIMSQADIYLSTSLSEGMSMALLEAMAAELPVVTTAVEGVANVVAHEKNGLIVPVGDVEAIANAVIRLIGDPRMRHSLGGEAKESIVRSHSLERMCREYERLFYEYYGR